MEINPTDAGGTTPRKMLARRLRSHRARAGLSVRGLAEKIGYPYGYISRVENGKQLPSDALVEALDAFFETDGLFAELLEMCRGTLIADYSRAVVAREPEAERIQVFTSSLIPGLLQTEDYARELFRTGLPGASEDELEERVAVRMRRRSVFRREAPPFYWAVFDEAALRRPVDGTRCMRDQLLHVLQLMDHPHIAVQVLPFGQGAHSMLGGGLTLMALRSGEMLGLVESFANGEAVAAPRRLAELSQLMDSARSLALSEAETRLLIGKYLKGYEHENDS